MDASMRSEEIALAGGESGRPAEVEEALQPAEHFDVIKATNYSVANVGSSLVYGLLNTAMPLYLKQYGVPDWLIGPLANERALVGAVAQPVDRQARNEGNELRRRGGLHGHCVILRHSLDWSSIHAARASPGVRGRSGSSSSPASP